MKKLLLLAAAATLVLTGCKKDNNDPEPNTVVNNDQNKNKDNPNNNNGNQDPNNDNPSSLPNFLKACINRDAHPIFKFSGAIDVNEFHNNTNGIKDTVSKHFDEIVAGNAMKYGSVVNGSGAMNFDRVKQFCNDAKSAGLSIFGHTLAWHSQQQPGYLLGLMAGKYTYTYLDQTNNCLKYIIGNAGTNAWDHQAIYNLTNTMTKGKNYTVKVKIRASQDGECTLWPIDTKSSNKNEWGNSADVQYLSGVGVSTHWKEYTWNFNANFPIDRLQFVFGTMGGEIYFDDLSVTDASSNTFADNGDFNDTDISSWDKTECKSFAIFTEDKTEVATLTPLTDDEKRDALTSAMDQWIKGMMNATDGFVKAWDVVNEAIAGGGNIDGYYTLQHSSNPNDDEVVVKSGNFFWQDYMGDIEYVRTAVASARKHFKGNAADLKLFINDYNLESDWDDNKKLKSLIYWIEKWEADGVTKIDGIGTQMHISCYENESFQKSAEEHIVKMFQLMAATGKLVRVSELDMGYIRGNSTAYPNPGVIGTSQVTAAEHKKMANFYKFIIQKYFEIVPAAQQYGICQWCLTDAPGNLGDQGGWRPGQPVGIWTQGFKQRKEAFKGFAEGLAEKK